MKKTVLALLTLLTAILCLQGIACAETYHVTATGKYVIGDRDSLNSAKKHAIEEAKRMAVDKAGVYVESYSKTNNFVLTEDEAIYIASEVISYETQDVYVSSDGATCIATVTATLNTDSIAKQLRQRDQVAPQGIPEVTGLVIDYGPWMDNKSKIVKHLDVYDCIKAEDGTVVYDRSFYPKRSSLYDGLCYHDHNLDRILNVVGNHALRVVPLFFELDKYGNWRTPVLKQHEADYIREANALYHFLDNGKICIWSWQ